MNDDLLDNYNPLYDVHLRQYFAMPHMQRHLRNIGLLDDVRHGEDMDDRESNKHHHAIIDKTLRNREAELQKYADLQRKLHAAEKIEICRRIRSGAASPSDHRRTKPSRSLSRGRYMKRLRRRRSSASIDDKDLVQKIEAENEEPMYENPSLVYNRLSTNILKYRYLHKLDDETLALYMEHLRRQLSRLERFRQVSFGPFSVARHQNDPQVSWFFRRRSLPSLTDTTPTTTITTTTTITSSATQSSIHEHPTLRSIQQLNQHRSRSSKPQLQRNDIYDNSHGNHSQSKRLRSTTENNARLPPVSRNVKSGLTAIRTSHIKKSTPTEAKKVVQKTTATPTGRKPFGVVQKIKLKTDSELADVQATISAAPNLVGKSRMESDKHRSEGSSLNLDDEREVYSSVNSPEDTDLRPGGDTTSEKSISPLNQSKMSLDDEKRSQSNLSEQMVEQSEIEHLKIENKQNSNLLFNLSPEMLEKTELESVNKETPLVSKWMASGAVENLVSRETPTNLIANEIDSCEMIVPEEINANRKLNGNRIETENKSERLPTGESSTTESEIVQIGKQQDQRNQLEEMFTELPTEELKLNKMIVGEFEKPDEIISSSTGTRNLEIEKLILPEDKLPEINDIEMSVEVPMLVDSNTFSHAANQKVMSNEAECDMNEFVAINGEILEISPGGELKEYDSFAITEAYSPDLKEETLVAEKNLEERVENPNPIDEDLVSSAVYPEKSNSVDEQESAVCCTEIESTDGEQESADKPIHFTHVTKVESAIDQDAREHIKKLSKLPESIPVMDDEKMTKSEISFEQVRDSTANEYELSNSEQLSEETEIANGMTKKEELESMKGVFQVEKLPDCSIDEQLKYEEKNIVTKNGVTDGSFGEKSQQPDANIDGLEFISNPETEEKSESFFTNDAPLIANFCTEISKEIIESMEVQQTKKDDSEKWLGAEVSEAKSIAGAEITNNGVQKVNDVLQTESEPPESARSDSVTQQLMQYMKSSIYDDALVEGSKIIVQETEPEMGEMNAVEIERVPEAILLNAKNLIIEGITNNSEPVIVGMQESQPFILTPIEKRESDVQENVLTSNIFDSMSSNADDSFEKEYRTEEILNKSTDDLNLTKGESNSFEHAVDSLTSDILRTDMTSVESNSEVTFEKKSEKVAHSIPANNIKELETKEAVRENEALSEVHYASHEVLPSEAIVCENLGKVTVAGMFDVGGIPKIVVCSDETVVPDVEKMENLVVQSDKENIEEYQVEAGAKTLHQQKPPQEIKDMEQSEIFRNEEVITSVRSDASEELDDGKQSTKGYLNKFLQQYVHDMVQNITQIAEERTKTSKALEEGAEQIEIRETDESQHVLPVPECIPEFPTQVSAIGFSKSEFDEALQKQVENVHSHCSVLSSMITTNDSDESTEALESSGITGEPMTISSPYHATIIGGSEEGQDNGVLGGHGLGAEYDITSQEVGSDAVEEFSDDIERIGQVERYAQELELEFEKGKLESEIFQTKSFTNNMLQKYHLIVSGLTANGQLILSSVSESIPSPEDKFINYFPPNNDDYETVNDKIEFVSDRNGNPEWQVCDMQHIPSDVLNESNICAADMNANISSLQETVHMKSIKHEQEMDKHSAISDEHLFLEQSNTETEERETVNYNSKCL
ncbi:unnamed protein product [Cercopithifilaria johnstoni]|uniref:Uncharacterized protein n=1 Tax=Cercopithifilaria johnstoni TaxID=2874296 RepID=A0A8J2PYR9_9BILA|nr:unnamed protein product [Cercopithifilaria johnstoni]